MDMVYGQIITAISQEAFRCPRELVDVETRLAVADQNLLFKVTTIVKPVKTDFSDDSTLAFQRVSSTEPASSVSTAMKQLDTFACHLRSLGRQKKRGYHDVYYVHGETTCW